MMQNSPDPEEEEEVLEEEEGAETSSQADSVLLQEMQALTQTFNNNWSYEGEGPGGRLAKDYPYSARHWAHASHVADRTSLVGSWQHLSYWAAGETLALLGGRRKGSRAKLKW